MTNQALQEMERVNRAQGKQLQQLMRHKPLTPRSVTRKVNAYLRSHDMPAHLKAHSGFVCTGIMVTIDNLQCHALYGVADILTDIGIDVKNIISQNSAVAGRN